MILAEELEADWKQIEIEQAGASTLYGDQGTGGSASVKTTWDPMRKAGAAAREMLISAAALTWGVPRSSCAAENGAVVHGASKRRLSYGDLVEKAATLPIPTDVPLKQNKDYKIVGHRLARVDTPSKVRGKAVFGIDFRMPGMKYAVLSRSPTIGGKALSFDDKDSRKIPGVSYVGKISDAAVAVVADSVWGAMEGRRMLNVNWDAGPNKDLNTAAVMEALQRAASKKGASLYSAGDVSKVTGRRISAEYHLPFMAHAPMEPGNCTAHFQGTSCELWAPTQVPQDCRDQVAKALGMDPDQVKVNVTLMGGGFGRRLEYDYAVEAALVSKAVNNPVKVIWTREDDMRFSTYRPMSLHQLSAVLDGAGWPVAFTHRIVAPSISGQKGQPGPNGVDPDLPDEAAFIYGLPNVSLEYVLAETAVPLGWMRSVYALQAAFASESFIDELAVAAGKDPLEYRLHMLGKDQNIQYFDTAWRTARMRGVLQLAADKAGWKNSLPAGRFRGIACFGCFSSYMAEVVEISMENDEPRVHRVVAAVDCGQVVNPSILEQQIQGGIVYALTNALRAKITIEKGRVVQGNFDDYVPLRMDETPTVEVYAAQNTEAPSGIGEPSVPPLAPALCSAIHAATKKRVRALPILS
ncbi:MAG: xanthine dehydrogenase family protein molybdopterin-binding subunit, partial [Candidatus Sulfotelmatobacter sp.]